jgi:hypothetical protein
MTSDLEELRRKIERRVPPVGKRDSGDAGKRRYSQLVCSAYHEAGHAVTAHVLGRRFTGVAVVAEADPLGRCQYAEERNFDPDLPGMYGGPQIRSVVEHQIVGYLAGPIAQGILTGEKSWRETSGRGDIPRAVDLAMYMTGDIKETEAYLERLWVRTESLLRLPENWGAVRALAAELIEARHIGEERAREIIAAGVAAELAVIGRRTPDGGATEPAERDAREHSGKAVERPI